MACCSTRKIIATFAVFVWIFIFDGVVNGVLFADLYAAHAHLWRPMPDMQAMMPYCVLYHLAMAALFTCGYFHWRGKITTGALFTSECPYRKSMYFGLWVGLLLGIPQLMVYMWMPITLHLPMLWAGSEIVKWFLGGMLLNKLYGKPAA